jgi:hypothetical protein
VSSQAEAERQAQLRSRARALLPHAGDVVQREERVETGFGLVPGEDSLGPGDVAEALGVHLLQLWLPEVAPLAVEGLPLRPERIAVSVEGPERLRALAHGNVGGGGDCEVRSAAKRRTGAGEAEAAVAKGEGDLLCQGAVCGGPAHDGEGAVDRLVLCPLDGWADLRPMVAARQVCSLCAGGCRGAATTGPGPLGAGPASGPSGCWHGPHTWMRLPLRRSQCRRGCPQREGCRGRGAC